MKVLTEGHKYQLSGFENAENTQEIQFIEKTPIEGTTELKTVNDGTTNEIYNTVDGGYTWNLIGTNVVDLKRVADYVIP